MRTMGEVEDGMRTLAARSSCVMRMAPADLECSRRGIQFDGLRFNLWPRQAGAGIED